jgi:hypothetical protein
MSFARSRMARRRSITARTPLFTRSPTRIREHRFRFPLEESDGDACSGGGGRAGLGPPKRPRNRLGGIQRPYGAKAVLGLLYELCALSAGPYLLWLRTRPLLPVRLGKRPRRPHPYEFICKAWTSQTQRFTISPLQKMPGLNT